ncbi:hypothetical protein [Alkalicoccobacillus plakortidis]|uniref:Uncharacterized protein n=1 Tax=Alkalicoccobacillus plakortidis TaxID=444060 RepID=A0ABT0XMR1_9BACI|nr:hypothetical protein [Alkalicoccobacillus plakortidis]MCM2677020.1 hypothetical protein [Alkalicoccobacillus plakortidis]
MMSEFKHACRTMLLTPAALVLTLILLPVLLVTDVPILHSLIDYINQDS